MRALLSLLVIGLFAVPLALLSRIPRPMARPASLVRRAVRRIRNAIIAAFLAVLAMVVIAIVAGPIGIEGVIFGMLLIMLAPVVGALWPSRKPRPITNARDLPLAALPEATMDYVDSRWGELPYAAYPRLDHIRETLHMLAPQLDRLDPLDPATHSLRQLIGVHLPSVIENYTNVPRRLRSGTPLSSGKTVDQQLVDSLDLVAAELEDAATHAAQGHLSAFDAQGRFLEARRASSPVAH